MGQSHFDYSEIQKMLYGKLTKVGDYSESECRDIAFHMADWCVELDKLAMLYQRPDSFTHEEAEKAVMDFLIAALEHVAEAARVMTDTEVEYIFRKDELP